MTEVLVKYTGKEIGPILTTPLLNRKYDFTKGQCIMLKEDADLLIQRCGHSYDIIEAPAVVPKAKAKPSVGKDK